MTIHTFITHDNGGRPFRVTVNTKKLTVSVYNNETNKIILKDIKPEHVHVGSDETKPRENNLGNSLLLQLKNNRYMYIGNVIYEFTAHARIFKYESPIGNSDVPYPWAMDEKGYVYLFVEDVVLSPVERKLDFLHFLQHPSPYTYYYSNNEVLDKNVEAEFSGIKQSIHLSYEPIPDTAFKRLNPVYVHGKALTKAQFAKKMKDFGKKMGYAPFKSVKLIQARLY